MKISDETGDPCIDADWQCPKCEKKNTMEIDLYNLSVCLTRCEHCGAACGVQWVVEVRSQAGLLREGAEMLAGAPKSETGGSDE